jgi:membrane-associated protease RseP (regulator of RpoE activity)
VSSQGYTADPDFPSPANGAARPAASYRRKPVGRLYWLNLLLLILTLVTTSAMGARMLENFERSRPIFDVERDWSAIATIWQSPSVLALGLPFSITLMTILLAHELGHYLACRYYRVDASLPYFLPVPFFIGTFGAFIRIRSPIFSKQVLYDVGIAGPLAGFAFVLPALSIGLAYSKIVPGITHRGDLSFGIPPLLWLMEKAIFPGVPAADIYLHPIARAAWVGIFATALNLLPIGQLDGGHILYSFLGEKHTLLSRIFVLVLVPMGLFFWTSWLVWAVVLLILGLRHPSIFDATPLSPGRRRLGWLALAMFLLCFMPAPIAELSLLGR